MDKRAGIYLVLLTALISGASVFLNSFAVKGFDSSVFTFSKNVLVALLLLAILLGLGQYRQIVKLTKKQWLSLGAIGLIGGSIPFLLFFKGLQMTSGATSGFIHKTMFVFVAILAILFLKEKLTKGIAIGAVLLLLGNYLVLQPNFAFGAGHLLILAATILWAAENTLAKHVVKDVSGTIIAFGRMFFGSIFILAFLAAAGKTGEIFSMSLAQYGWIVFTAALLLGYVLTFYNGIRHIKITTAACILTLGSPVTTALTFLRSGTITPFEITGALLITAGIASVLLLKEEAAWTASA